MNWLSRYLPQAAIAHAPAETLQDNLEALAEPACSQSVKSAEPALMSKACDSLILDQQKFASTLTSEISRFNHAHQALSKSHETLNRKFGALTASHRDSSAAAQQAQAHNSVLAAENMRLRLDNSAFDRKVELLSMNLLAAQERAEALQQRIDSLEADYAQALAGLELSEARCIEFQAELQENAAHGARQELEIEALRTRAADLEAKNSFAAADLEEVRFLSAPAIRLASEQSGKIAALEAHAVALQESLANAERQAKDERVERESVAAALSNAAAKTDEERRAFGSKIDALAKTKTFLWRMSEKQRRVIADQISKISQLETSNSKISHLLLDSSKHQVQAGEANSQPQPQAQMSAAH